LWASAAAGGPGGPGERERESGRERGGDKPYESRKRAAMRGAEGGRGGEWSGKGGWGMAMLGSDSDMGGAWLDSIRFDSTVYQRYSFSSVSLSLALMILSPSRPSCARSPSSD
jgi:hypothetical protein